MFLLIAVILPISDYPVASHIEFGDWEDGAFGCTGMVSTNNRCGAMSKTDMAIEVVGVNGAMGRGGTIDSGGPVVAADMAYTNSGYTTFGREATWFAGPGNVFMAYGLREPE
ncbi:MAG: hypothetical protein ACI9GW_003265 [Halieaceae bacterium]|jgi:hypothetical protein